MPNAIGTPEWSLNCDTKGIARGKVHSPSISYTCVSCNALNSGSVHLTALNPLAINDPAKPATLLTPTGEGMLAVVALPTGSGKG